MSYAHINFVRDHSKTTGLARLLLLTIATRADKDGYCYPSYKCLAQDTQLRSPTISRLLKKIPPDELIIVQKGGSRKGQKRQHYIYRIPSSPDSSHSDNSQKNTVTKDNADCSHSSNSTVINDDTDCSHGKNLTISKQSKEQPATAAFLLFELTDERIEELQKEFKRYDIRKRYKEALAKCSELYPGKPMGLPWFREFLRRECMHPADPEGYAAQKKAEADEAKQSRAASPLSETKEQCVQRLSQQFPTVDVQNAASSCQKAVNEKGKPWNNGHFVEIVTTLYQQLPKPS